MTASSMKMSHWMVHSRTVTEFPIGTRESANLHWPAESFTRFNQG